MGKSPWALAQLFIICKAILVENPTVDVGGKVSIGCQMWGHAGWFVAKERDANDEDSIWVAEVKEKKGYAVKILFATSVKHQG